MSAPRTGINPAPDQRLLALLALGVAICLFRSVPGFSSAAADEPSRPPVYYWLAGEGLAEGLYRIDPAILTYGNQAFAQGIADLPIPEPEILPVAAFRLNPGEPPAAFQPPPWLAPYFFAPIPINRADHELLTTLPGIGPKLAEAIIAHRQEKGEFKALPEITKVKGIGKAKMAALDGQISFD
jgi:competence ComEA-like helix-hairpin-helix protein